MIKQPVKYLVLIIAAKYKKEKPKATILLRWLMFKGDSVEYEEWLVL